VAGRVIVEENEALLSNDRDKDKDDRGVDGTEIHNQNEVRDQIDFSNNAEIFESNIVATSIQRHKITLEGDAGNYYVVLLFY